MSLIEVRNLYKKFRDIYVLTDLNFDVFEGEIFGILGPNGAGKTTILEILEGIIPKTKGSVSVLKLDPFKDKAVLHKNIGVQFQVSALQKKLKVKEIVELFSSFYLKYDFSLLEKLNLSSYLEYYYYSLSFGLKQKLAIFLSLLHDPKIVFLDEPSNGLDAKARRDLWNLIFELKKRRKTVIITTHYIEEAEQLCDRVAFFYKGKILAIDKPKELIAKEFLNKHILFETNKELDLKLLSAIEGVRKVLFDGRFYKVYCKDLQYVSLKLFDLAFSNNFTITNFRFELGSLEELFLKFVENKGFLKQGVE